MPRPMFPPLEERLIRVDLSGPMRDAADPKVLSPDSVSSAENAFYVDAGEVRKIGGTDRIEYDTRRASTTLSECAMLDVLDGELAATGITRDSSGYSHYDEYYQLHVYDEGSGTDGEFVAVGTHTPVVQDSLPIISQSAVNTPGVATELMKSPDIAVLGGYTWHAWTDDVKVYLRVCDEDTGSPVETATIRDGGGSTMSNVKLLAVDTKVHLYYLEGNAIKLVVLDPDDPSPSSYTILAKGTGSASPNKCFDACVYTDSSHGACSCQIWSDPGSGGQIRIYANSDSNGTLHRNVLMAGGAGTRVPKDCMTVKFMNNYDTGTTYLYIVYKDDADTKLYTAIYDDTVSQQVAPTLLEATAYGNDMNAMTITEDPVVQMIDGGTVTYLLFFEYNTAGGAGRFPTVDDVYCLRVNMAAPWTGVSYQERWHHHSLYSKAFTWKDRAHVWLMSDGADDIAGNDLMHESCVLVCTADRNSGGAGQHDFRCVAHMHQDNVYTRTLGCLPEVPAYTGTDLGKFVWTSVIKEHGQRGKNINSMLRSLRKNTLTFGSNGYKACLRKAEFGKTTILNGGHVYTYDGRCRPSGFLYPPVIASFTDQNVGAGSIPQGTYRYIAVFQWTDDRGEVHYSSASNDEVHDTTAGAGGDRDHDVEIRGIMECHNIKDVKIALYRSSDGAGTDYNLVEIVDNPMPGALTVTVRDDTTDATKASAETPYFYGGVLEDDMPPPAYHLCEHGGRMWLISSEDRTRLYYSKEKVDGICAQFPGLFYISMPERINAIASLGNQLVAFSDNKIYAVGGEGPDSLGSGAFWQPRIVSGGMGCSNLCSLAETGMGIVFQSHNNAYLLDRDFSLKLLSHHNSDQFVLPLLRTVEMVGYDTVWFASTAGYPLAYNFRFDRWSSQTSRFSADSVCYFGGHANNTDGFWQIVDYGGYYGVLLKPTNSTYTRWPGGGKYSLEVKTPWLNLAGLSEFKRIWEYNIVGSWVASHTARVQVYVNYDDSTVAQQEDFSITSDPGGYVLRFKPKDGTAKVMSVMLVVSDYDSATASMRLTSAEVSCGFKGNTNRRATSTS